MVLPIRPHCKITVWNCIESELPPAHPEEEQFQSQGANKTVCPQLLGDLSQAAWRYLSDLCAHKNEIYTLSASECLLASSKDED